MAIAAQRARGELERFSIIDLGIATIGWPRWPRSRGCLGGRGDRGPRSLVAGSASLRSKRRAKSEKGGFGCRPGDLLARIVSANGFGEDDASAARAARAARVEKGHPKAALVSQSETAHHRSAKLVDDPLKSHPLRM
jgi:hypothetical protein